MSFYSVSEMGNLKSIPSFSWIYSDDRYQLRFRLTGKQDSNLHMVVDLPSDLSLFKGSGIRTRDTQQTTNQSGHQNINTKRCNTLGPYRNPQLWMPLFSAAIPSREYLYFFLLYSSKNKSQTDNTKMQASLRSTFAQKKALVKI